MTDEETIQRKNLEDHFLESFSLTPEASNFLLKVWRAIQLFDDVADGDAVERTELNAVLFDFFLGFMDDPFMVQNATHLKPHLVTLVLKWQASDIAERNGEASARSYMWRAGYYDLILFVVFLVHGYDQTVLASKDIMDFYGESLEEYLGEFNA